MSEPGAQEVGVIAQVEALTPEQRVHEYLDVTLYSWLERDFKQEMTRLIRMDDKNHTVEWAEKKVSLQNQFVSAIYLLRETNDANTRRDVADIWEQKLSRLMIGDRPGSLIAGLSLADQYEMNGAITGCYTTLTLIDALTRARPSLKGQLRPSRVMAHPVDDVHGKTDLVINLGDRNMYGETVVRLLQLKKHSGADIIISPITDENMDHLPGIDKYDAKKIIQTGKKIQATRPQEQLEMRHFVVLVPGVSSASIQEDVWGRIKDNDIIDRFKFDAKATGLIPMQTQQL